MVIKKILYPVSDKLPVCMLQPSGLRSSSWDGSLGLGRASSEVGSFPSFHVWKIPGSGEFPEDASWWVGAA